MIVIVGAGLAGLVCARMLRQAGSEVLVLEQQVVPGGRVRTERHPEGFLLDRGFQVLFTAYPAAQRHLSFSRLNLQVFTPGALIALDGKLYPLADPIRAAGYAVRSATMPLFGPGDKMRALALAFSLRRMSPEAIFASEDQTTEAYLQGRGFSPRFIDRFIRPFYGGIFLDRTLGTSSSMFQFIYTMLTQGETAIPSAGMQEIPEQLAKALPADAIHYGVTVTGIVYEQGRAAGVVTEDGRQIDADAVVVATDPPAAARMLDTPALPHQPVACTCVYFATPSSLYAGRLIVLNAHPDAYVNNMVQIDNIAPGYAPHGQHLLSLTILGSDPGTDDQVEQRCLADLSRMFPGASLAGLRLLRIIRIPFAQFAQPPGIFRALGAAETPTANIFLASEATFSSSIQGAMAGGEHAARLLLDRLPATTGR